MVSADEWRACTSAHCLVRWSRRVGNARKFLLLGCAIVRNWPGGVQSELGRNVLEAVEAVARGAGPAPSLRLCEDILHPLSPVFVTTSEVHFAVHAARHLLKEDINWLAPFTRAAAFPGQTGKALPNLLIDRILAVTRANADGEVAGEIEEIRRKLTHAKPAGFFQRLLGITH